MNEINFLPESFIRARKRRVRMVREAMLVCVVVVLMASWFVAARGRLARLDSFARFREAEAAAAQEQMSEMVKLRLRHETLTHQVKIQRTLAQPLDHSVIIASVGALMNDTLVLMQLELTGVRPSPSRDQDAVTAAATRGRPVQRPDTLALVLVGLAPDDEQITDFVARMQDHKLFDETKMIYSRAANLREMPVREFRIEARILLDRDYKALPTEGGLADAS